MWLRIDYVPLEKKLSNNEKELISDLNSRLWKNFQLEMTLYIVFFGKRQSLFYEVSTNICENLFLKFRNFLSSKTFYKRL